MNSYKLWAKKKEYNGIYYWLPLSVHLEDTKSIIGLLWEHWLGHGQKEIIIDNIGNRNKAKQLAMFLGAVHDIGKATPAFQIKRNKYYSSDLDNQLLDQLQHEGFSNILNLNLPSADTTKHQIASQFILKRQGVKEDIACIVGAHHGKPVDDEREIENQIAFVSNYFQTETPTTEVYRKWETVQSEYFQWALKSCSFDSVYDLPSVSQPAQIILSGLLIMADWIASNENYFPLFKLGFEEISDQNRIERGFRKWFKGDLWEPFEIHNIDKIYLDRFDFFPRNFQRVLTETIQNTNNPGIYIVEATMGIGKTEAALIGAEQLAEKTSRNGLFFGLPTQATSNGMFPRIVNWLERLQYERDEIASLRLVHGKSQLNDHYENLRRSSNIWEDDDEKHIFVNEWFSGRKAAMLDDFIVGTVDQFLMVALKHKHLALRHLGFSKKVIVIDEIHAFDAYMNQYLSRAIELMATYRVPIILLSATLPAQKRYDFISAYARGLGKAIKRKDRIELKLKLNTLDYPLITYSDRTDDGELEVKLQSDFQKSSSFFVNIKKISSDNLFNYIDEIMEIGGVVGIIVNTVNRAQSIGFKLIERYGDVVNVVHSQFISTHRIKKEKLLLREVGSDAIRPKKRIIIGTQVIEQSLDIDFDVLFTDLAPIDLLLQRIGRLHRHKIERPTHLSHATTYILGANPDWVFEPGSVAVYGEYLLARTESILPEIINIPIDIPQLVQCVYSDEDECPKDSFVEKYHTFKEKYMSTIELKRNNAKDYLLDGSSEIVSLVGWLKNSSFNEEENHSQVRDTEPSLEVVLLEQDDSGYKIIGENIELSIAELNEKTTREIAKQTVRLPGLFVKKGIIKTIRWLEEYNSKHEYLKMWQEHDWLKGTLGIILDKNREFCLDGVKLVYSTHIGLLIEKGDDIDGKI